MIEYHICPVCGIYPYISEESVATAILHHDKRTHRGKTCHHIKSRRHDLTADNLVYFAKYFFKKPNDYVMLTNKDGTRKFFIHDIVTGKTPSGTFNLTKKEVAPWFEMSGKYEGQSLHGLVSNFR